MNCADSREKWIWADALHVSCDWLFAARVTLSGARAPELITNWFKLWVDRVRIHQALWARWTWSKPGWFYQVLSTQNLLCNSEFVHLASYYRPPIYWDFHAQPSIISMVRKSELIQWVAGLCLVDARGQRRMARFKLMERHSNSNDHSLQTRKANEHLWMHNVLNLKGIVHPKMKILSSFTHPQVVPNLYEFLCSAEHKGRYFEESL